MIITTVLVPVDFSACSRAALLWAAEVAEPFGANVDVLHVWEPPRHAMSEYAFETGRIGTSLAEFSHTQAGDLMREFLTILEARGLGDVRGRLDIGDPVSTILRIAESDRYDLVVMGTHGRTGLAHLLLGSVAEKVVRRAPCPVLTIRSPDVSLVDPIVVQWVEGASVNQST